MRKKQYANEIVYMCFNPLRFTNGEHHIQHIQHVVHDTVLNAS